MNSQTKNYIIGALASFIINIALILLPLYVLAHLRDYKIGSTEHKTTLDIKNFNIDEEPTAPQKSEESPQKQESAAGEPLDVLVNGTLIAHGEVVVVNDKFGIRLTDVISQTERIKKLK